jgi:hypothetical protein
MSCGTRFDHLAVYAEKLPGCIFITPNRTFEAVVLILAILASFLAHRTLRRYTLSQTNCGVLERSWLTALIKRATACLVMRFSVSDADVL